MYTLALGSGSGANQLVARNALLQMVVTAFKRMEAELASRPPDQRPPSPSRVAVSGQVRRVIWWDKDS
jgi:hypothetical protein